MSGETHLQTLIATMQPIMSAEQYVVCSFAKASYGDYCELSPLASLQEEEGLTLVVRKQEADSAHLTYNQIFRCITLNVHSSLQAVGFTAAIATELTKHQISANMMAGMFHDHLLIQQEKAEHALLVLQRLSCKETTS